MHALVGATASRQRAVYARGLVVRPTGGRAVQDYAFCSKHACNALHATAQAEQVSVFKHHEYMRQ